jgi:hypothetical protein
MRKTLTAVILVAAVATSGCSLFKSRSAAAPDEFANELQHLVKILEK